MGRGYKRARVCVQYSVSQNQYNLCRSTAASNTLLLHDIFGTTLHYLLSFHAINFTQIMITALKLLFCIHVNILSNIVTTSV